MERRDALLELFTEPVVVGATYKDADGRTLAEMNATRKLKEGVEFTLRECPYEGSRQGKLMNVSGLKQLTDSHRMIVRDTHMLRGRFLALHGLEAIDLGALWRFARALSSVPVFAVRRRDSAVAPLEVPAPYSAMFKIAQGLHMAAERMIFAGWDPSRRLSAEEVVEFVEERGLFLSLDGTRACAGPLNLVLDFVRAAIDAEGDERSADHGVVSLLGPDDAWARYADAITDIVIAKSIQEVEGRRGVAELGVALKDPGYDEKAERGLGRFGYFRSVPLEEAESVHATMLRLSKVDSSGFGCARETQIAQLAELLEDHVADLGAESAAQVARHLGEELARERDWLLALQSLQSEVLASLGHDEEAPSLSSHDFRGLGHSVREVVSAWLSVGITNTADGLEIKMGDRTVELA